MPITENMMFSRPLSCRYCGHGYYGLLHVINYAIDKGYWNIIDMSDDLANKDPIYAAITENDPASFFGFGHGNNCIFTGDAEQAIFTCDECNMLTNKIVYLHSCLTANGLGPAIINNGGIAYAGFDMSWTWASESGTGGDPYDDKYARGFFESSNELWLSMIDHKTIREAADDSIAKYNEWIDYWLEGAGSGDPYASQMAGHLALDRDGLTLFGDLDAKLEMPYTCEEFTTKDECLAHGCWWYDNSCHSQRPPTVLETKTFTIYMLPGLAKIENLICPSKAYEEQQFNIEYDAKNMASPGTLWGQIVDIEMGTILEGSYWEQPVTDKVHIITRCDPITKNVNWKIQVGHIEEET